MPISRQTLLKLLATVIAFMVIVLIVWVSRAVFTSYQNAQLNDKLAKAQEYVDREQYQEALEIYRTIGISSNEPLYNLTKTYLKLGQSDQAQETLNKISDQFPMKNELTKIIVLYNNGRESRNDPFEQASVARSLLQKDYTLLAVSLLGEVINTSPDYRDAHLLMGTALFKTGQAQNALSSFEQAAEIDPTYPTTFQLMGKVYEALGDTEKAQQLKEKADKLQRP